MHVQSGGEEAGGGGGGGDQQLNSRSDISFGKDLSKVYTGGWGDGAQQHSEGQSSK